jgi:hypothetical protein
VPPEILGGIEVAIGVPWQTLCEKARTLEDLVVIGSHGYANSVRPTAWAEGPDNFADNARSVSSARPFLLANPALGYRLVRSRTVMAVCRLGGYVDRRDSS